MADILIRGIEMPKHCIDCPLMVDRFDTDACALQSQEANEAFESWEDMRRNCPLLHLPAGHGRLIDADEVIEAYTPDSYELNKMHMTRESFDKRPTVAAIKRAISNAPTIVPAEGETEDG